MKIAQSKTETMSAPDEQHITSLPFRRKATRAIRFFACFVTLLVLSLSYSAQAQTVPELLSATDIGMLPGANPYTLATTVGPNGNVAGYAFYLPDGHIHAFWWTEATGMIDIGPAGTDSWAKGVNGHGQVVGNFTPLLDGAQIVKYFSGERVQHAFLWSQTDGFVDLGTIPNPGFLTEPNNIWEAYIDSYAYGINEKGQIVGYSSTYGLSRCGVNRAFVWNPTTPNGNTGTFTDLGSLDVDRDPQSCTYATDLSLGYAINNNGAVTGESPYNQAFYWDPIDGIVDMGLLTDGGYSIGGVRFTPGPFINDSGQVVGQATTPTSSGQNHPFLWSKSTGMQDLGTLGGPWGDAWAISPNGLVTGRAMVDNTYYHAFLYTPGSTMVDLSPNSAFSSHGIAVDSSGLVVGWSGNYPGLRASAWQDGQILDLHPSGADYSEVKAMSQDGTAVGFAYFGGFAYTHSFVWKFPAPTTAALPQLQKILDALETLSESEPCTAYDQHQLTNAIEALTTATEPASWIDDDHLSAKKGTQVFAKMKVAAQKLEKIQVHCPDMSEQVQSLIDQLVDVAISLSTTAISELNLQNPSSMNLAKAQEQLARGETSDNAGNGINYYKKAWKKANTN